jgi:hypothetical protein
MLFIDNVMRKNYSLNLRLFWYSTLQICLIIIVNILILIFRRIFTKTSYTMRGCIKLQKAQFSTFSLFGEKTNNEIKI